MNPRTIALIVALGVVIAVTQWLLQQQADDSDLDVLPAARSDYILEDFDLAVMNPDGQARFVMAATRLERNPADGSAVVAAPKVRFFSEGRHEWTLTSREGWVGDEATVVRFDGDVDLVSTAEAPTRLQTQSVTVYPDESRAEGDGHILITEPQARIEGVGFHADLDRQAWDLLSDVRATLLPSPNP
ncbi:MAG: LPS export ABC transporter periplasmic protein LptC [Pseudomonadota bacterium]